MFEQSLGPQRDSEFCSELAGMRCKCPSESSRVVLSRCFPAQQQLSKVIAGRLKTIHDRRQHHTKGG